MNTINEILRGVVGLFVDDELLAVGVLGVVGLAALCRHIPGVNELVAGAVLLFGCLFVLVIGAVRTAQRKP